MQFIPTRSYFRFVRLSWKCVSLGELLPTSERALFLGAYTQWPCFTRFPWAAPVLSLRSALGVVLFSPFKQVLSLTDCVLTFMQIGTCSIFKRSPARIWRSLWESLPSVVVCCIHSRCLGLPDFSSVFWTQGVSELDSLFLVNPLKTVYAGANVGLTWFLSYLSAARVPHCLLCSILKSIVI